MITPLPEIVREWLAYNGVQSLRVNENDLPLWVNDHNSIGVEAIEVNMNGVK